MKKIRRSITLTLMLGLLTVTAAPAAEPAAAGAADTASVDALVSAIRSNRKALVAANLQLTDEEATKFWPVYDRYQGEMNPIGDRFVAMVQDYTTSFPNIPDDKAMKLVNDYLGIENDRVALRRTYVPEFAKVLPGRKVARLYQLENKIDAVIRYDLASTVPVVEGESGASK
jgi:hypothetical protein